MMFEPFFFFFLTYPKKKKKIEQLYGNNIEIQKVITNTYKSIVLHFR